MVLICPSCGEEKDHHAKGLCKSCYMKQWRATNHEHCLAYDRDYRLKHRPARIAYLRNYRAAKPEKIRAYRKTRRKYQRLHDLAYEARKRNLPNTLTKEQAQRLLLIGRTIYPREDLHLDHIVPLSKGGGTTLANIHAVPAWVNLGKQDRLPQDVYEQWRL